MKQVKDIKQDLKKIVSTFRYEHSLRISQALSVR